MNWDSIPQELRWTSQWCVAVGSATEKAPLTRGADGSLRNASVTTPSDWLSFADASALAAQHGLNVGFVLHTSDPYTCIDLDVVDAEVQAAKGQPVDPSLWTNQEQLNRFWAIVQAFDSYTELSRSGKGLHIWIRGSTPKGYKRDGVEVYPHARFIICTGNVLVNKPIADRQELLSRMCAEMGAREQAELVEQQEIEADEVVWSRASNAANDGKFIPLCEGKWQELGYPSQSEADLALMSMFTFYSRSNEQCRRMFRATALGTRDKATKDDRYLNLTLKEIRARQAREDRVVSHGEQIATAFMNNLQRSAREEVSSLVRELQSHAAEQKHVNANIPQQPPAVVTMAQMAPLPPLTPGDLPWPPGLAGAIAGFIYQSAPRPVREVAIVAALGLLAGICGKQYIIPGSGLNLYIILVARSGVGKEAMHQGVSYILEALRQSQPSAMDYVDFNDFASGPALMKAVGSRQSFVNVAGEWGRKLKRIAQEDRPDGPMQGLRTVMTNLYQKSGPAAIVGGITYSNKEQNLQSVTGVAYSMIGETTPGTLFESLTTSMMEDGFLSRFTIVEYDGERPAHNNAALTTPDKALTDALAEIVQYVTHAAYGLARSSVGRDQEAADLMQAFDKKCDVEINSTKDETKRQMWNRAALKMMRMAALLAVADNYLHPVIQRHHVEWALEVIRRDIALMTRHMEQGNVGSGDNARTLKLMSILRDYLTETPADSYKIPPALYKDGIVPRSYLQTRVKPVSAFQNHRGGSILALDVTLKALIDNGKLLELEKTKQVLNYGYHGKCYRILDLD